MNSTDDRTFFEKHAYLVKRGLISPAEVHTLLNAVEELQEMPPASCTGRQMMYYEDHIDQPDTRILSRIEKFMDVSPALKSLAHDPRITETLESLFSSKPVLFKEKINFKAPGGQGFAPHQDIQAGWDDYVNYSISVLLTLDSSSLENGCLEMATNWSNRKWIGERFKPLTEENLAGVSMESLETEPGDVVFFDCFIPHGSGPNRTDTYRRNLYLTYNRLEDGDFREQYFTDKRENFPPDYERDPGKEYVFKV